MHYILKLKKKRNTVDPWMAKMVVKGIQKIETFRGRKSWRVDGGPADTIEATTISVPRFKRPGRSRETKLRCFLNYDSWAEHGWNWNAGHSFAIVFRFPGRDVAPDNFVAGCRWSLNFHFRICIISRANETRTFAWISALFRELEQDS